MINPEISLLDESLNKTNTGNYILNTQISMDEFTYCVLDSERNKYIAFEHYRLQKVHNPYQLADRLEELFNELSWLTGVFKAVKIIYVSRKSTIIPVPLYEENEKNEVFNFNHNLDESEDLCCDKMNNLNAYNLYGAPGIVKSKIRDLLSKFEFRHHMTTLLETLLLLNKNTIEKRFYVNVNSSQFDLALSDGNKLEYSNSFEYHTPEDFIYYILFVIQQLNLNPETLQVILMGEIQKNSPYYEIVFKYVRNVAFVRRNDSFQYSYVFDNLNPGSYFNLLNLSLSL